MTLRLKSIRKFLKCFFGNDRGVIMTEAILSLPILVLLAAGVLEFGSVLWQREQIVTGLRDSIRYLARCRHADATCDTTARNIAYYGSSAVGTLRVPGWNSTDSPITITRATLVAQDVVTASTTHTLLNSPLFGILGIATITVTLDHQQRDIGW
jgi:Flp pilus assembly protein TadG